jgi:ABC-type microcin C transport system permease subunit YejB
MEEDHIHSTQLLSLIVAFAAAAIATLLSSSLLSLTLYSLSTCSPNNASIYRQQ